jgi:hypothetical protein
MHIVVLLPIGIPGMGKTTFIEQQLKNFFPGSGASQVNIHTISSDLWRKKTIDLYLERNPNKT